MRRRSAEFLALMRRRRSVREFSDRLVERGVVEDCIRAAGTAPSGANRQPWHFVVVESPDMKRRIRAAAEAEERAFYEGGGQAWLNAVRPLGTTADKPFLDTAPFLIVVFSKMHGVGADGEKVAHYYPVESTAIATGVLVTALHHAGLGTLTYTPSRMGFLNDLLHRPDSERPVLIVVTGHPGDDAEHPDVTKKPLGDIATFL